MLRFEDKYLWDFWTVRRGAETHLFYLQAPRTPHDPELRHAQATVGHSVSVDLKHWESLPDAMLPGEPGAWDDRAIWTGSVIEKDGRFHMLYTGSTLAEDGKIQRIGLASSEDLVHWERHPENPVLPIDPTWYERLGDSAWEEEAWRDPYLVFDQTKGHYLAFICARANTGPLDGRGAIGIARSEDLIHWEVLPPATAPGEFTQMEVPQVVVLNEHYYLLFATRAEWHSAARMDRLGGSADKHSGTFAMVSDQLTQGYRLVGEDSVLANPSETYYAAKILIDGTGSPKILATVEHRGDEDYAGELSDPIPVDLDSDGALVARLPDPSG